MLYVVIFTFPKMKKLIVFLSVLSLLVSCQKDKKQQADGGKPVITVSILPQKTFVGKIAGDDFKVNVLIPPGASPAAYTLLPSQLKDIANSAAWFRIGYIGFEYSWKEKISQANKNMKVYDLSEGLDLIKGNPEHSAEQGLQNNAGVDPHVWLSPPMVKKMAKKIRDILSELYPENAQKYMSGYVEFIKEADQVDVEIKKILQGCEGKKMIVFHPSFTYFARDYGLKQVSLESGGKEPTPQHLKEVVDLAEKENIRIVYIQTELDLEQARVFAEEINGEIIQISPLDPDWSNNLIKLATTLRDNF